MKNSRNINLKKEIINGKLEYISPEFKCIDIEMESPILNSSDMSTGTGANSFEDGGSYDRGNYRSFYYEW